MKNFVFSLLALIVFVLSLGYIGNLENTYTKTDCVVVRVENEEITIKDKDGLYWTYKNNNYKEGDILELTMYSNGTTAFADDEITKVVKAN